MEIQTIDKATYKRLKKICAKAQAYWEANATYSRGGRSSLSKELAAHKDYAACTNEMRGQVDQYETLRDLPERLVAYVGDGGATVTTWTGLPLGTARVVTSWKQWSYSTRQFQYVATIGGRTYTGRSHGPGMCINLRETADSKRKRQGVTFRPVRHKDVTAACERYNKALGLHYWRGKEPPSRGYLQWADIRGDGRNRPGLYMSLGEDGGVVASGLRGKTMRETIDNIQRAIAMHKLPSYAVVIRCVYERGESQKAALRELNRRGLWLSDEQKAQAGL